MIEEELELVVEFMNTLDVDSDADVLGDVSSARRWLAEHGLVTAGEDVTARDLELARALREALRALAAANHDQSEDPRAAGRFSDVAGALPLRAVAGAGDVRVEPAAGGLRGGLGRIVALVADASTLGTWQRTKLCAADTCRWAFVDSSKNRSRRWCAMGVCGNRQKTRAYRERQREGPRS